MINILIVAFYLLVGIALQKVGAIPIRTAGWLNTYLIYIVLPVIAILYIPLIELSPELLLPALAAWICFSASWLFMHLMGNLLNWNRTTTGCLIITGGLANTSFLGFPIIEALFGVEGLQIALIVDQPGSFLIVSSLAIIVAAIYGEDKVRKRDISKRILLFPPFLFFLISIIMNLLDFQVGGYLQEFFLMIAWTLTPVALIAVGMQIKIRSNSLSGSPLWVGLGFSLVIAPALIYLIIGLLLNFEGLVFKVAVLEIAMPPMITASIIAITYNLNKGLASLMVGVGIAVSVLTLPLWYWILS